MLCWFLCSWITWFKVKAVKIDDCNLEEMSWLILLFMLYIDCLSWEPWIWSWTQWFVIEWKRLDLWARSFMIICNFDTDVVYIHCRLNSVFTLWNLFRLPRTRYLHCEEGVLKEKNLTVNRNCLHGSRISASNLFSLCFPGGLNLLHF